MRFQDGVFSTRMRAVKALCVQVKMRAVRWNFGACRRLALFRWSFSVCSLSITIIGT